VFDGWYVGIGKYFGGGTFVSCDVFGGGGVEFKVVAEDVFGGICFGEFDDPVVGEGGAVYVCFLGDFFEDFYEDSLFVF